MSAATEIWLAVGYAAFLLTVSSGLQWLARRTARGPRVPWLGRRGQDGSLRDEAAPWPQCDAARFERGLSWVVEVLAVFILAVTAVRHPTDWLLAFGALPVVVVLAQRRGLFLPRLWHALRLRKEARSFFRP